MAAWVFLGQAFEFYLPAAQRGLGQHWAANIYGDV